MCLHVSPVCSRGVHRQLSGVALVSSSFANSSGTSVLTYREERSYSRRKKLAAKGTHSAKMSARTGSLSCVYLNLWVAWKGFFAVRALEIFSSRKSSSNILRTCTGFLTTYERKKKTISTGISISLSINVSLIQTQTTLAGKKADLKIPKFLHKLPLWPKTVGHKNL